MNIQKQFTQEQKLEEQKHLKAIYGESIVDGNSVAVSKVQSNSFSKEEREFEIRPKLVNAYERKLRAEEEIAFLEAELNKLK